jgi:putative transposase
LPDGKPQKRVANIGEMWRAAPRCSCWTAACGTFRAIKAPRAAWNMLVQSDRHGLLLAHTGAFLTKMNTNNCDQIVRRLSQVTSLVENGKPVSQACAAVGISRATFYRWKSRYSQLGVDQMQIVRVLEDENANLKKTVSDLTTQVEVLQESLLGNY